MILLTDFLFHSEEWIVWQGDQGINQNATEQVYN